MESFLEHLYSSFIVEQRYMLILHGLFNTLIVTLGALVFGFVLGTVIALIRSSHHFSKRFRILNICATCFVYILRGTPVLVQLLIMKNVIFAHLKCHSILIGIFAFGLNSSAYVSEIIRSGILGVDVGQYEAGISLGFSSAQTLKLIIIPQAIKNSLPSLINEFSSLLKETAILSNIAIMDLTHAAGVIMSRTFLPLVYFVVAVIYLIIVSIVSLFLNRFQKKLLNQHSGG